MSVVDYQGGLVVRRATEIFFVFCVKRFWTCYEYFGQKSATKMCHDGRNFQIETVDKLLVTAYLNILVDTELDISAFVNILQFSQTYSSI